MGRKKKDEAILDEELELELDEEVDADEEELDEEELKKEPAEIAADSMDEEEAEPKPRKRASRAKKAVEPTLEETAPLVAAAAPAVVVEEKDAVVRQWEAAKQTTEAIVASLEKVNGLLRELPDHYAVVMQKSLKQSAPRSSGASKIAFGTSLLAILLSVLSLSFSQSARQAALSHEVSLPAVHHRAAEKTRMESAQTKPVGTDLDMLAALENTKNARAKRTKKAK